MSCMLFKSLCRRLLWTSLIRAACILLTMQVVVDMAHGQTRKTDSTRTQELNQLSREELATNTADARLSRSLGEGFSFAVVG